MSVNMSTPTSSGRQGAKADSSVSRPKSGQKLPETSAVDIADFLASRAGMSPNDHILALTGELKSKAADVKRNNDACLLDLKARKRAQESICRRRKLERNQWLLEMQKNDEAREEIVIDSGLGLVLSRQSVHEQRLTAHLLAVRREKQIMKENRQSRETQYREQRERDWAEFLRRESEACNRLRREQVSAKRALADQYEAVENQIQNLKKKEVAKMCQGIAMDIAEIAIKTSGYRQICDGAIPANVKRDLKILFLASKTISTDYLQVGSKDGPVLADLNPRSDNSRNLVDSSNPAEQVMSHSLQMSRIPVVPYDECMKELDEDEFQCYVGGFGIWAFKQQKEAKNPQLSEIVAKLLAIQSQCENKTIREVLPALGLRIAIIGKPYCRKSEIAERLSNLFDVSVLNSEKIVEIALKTNEQDPIIDRAKSVLAAGGELDDELLTLIVSRAVRAAATNGGILLKGFPRTRAQAVVLEHELTGFEEPRVLKPGALKRGDASSPVPQNSKQRSLISRDGVYSEQIDLTSPQGGPSILDALLQKSFDIVFYFTAKNDVIFERATSIRSDPSTSKTVYLDHGLPFPGEDGIHDRLVNNKESELGQLHLRLKSLEDEEVKILEWYQKLGTLCVIDANGNLETTLESCIETIGKVKLELSNQKSKKAMSPGNANIGEDSKAQDLSQSNSAEVSLDKSKKLDDSDHGKSRIEEHEKTIASTLMPPATTGSPQPLAAPQSANATKGVTPIDTTAKIRPPSTIPIQEKAEKMRKEIKRDPSTRFLQLLADEWILMELTFTNCMKYLFRVLRRERDILLRYTYSSKQHFTQFLKRPDEKQAVIHAFQLDFNSIYFDLRGDSDAKAELHHRVEDLREKLWEICDNRKEQADNEKASLIGARFHEDHIIIIAEIVTAMMQFEVNRYLSVKHVFLSYWKEMNNKVPEDEGVKSHVVSKPQLVSRDDMQLKLGASTMSLKRAPYKAKSIESKAKKNSSSFSLAARGPSQAGSMGPAQPALGATNTNQSAATDDTCELLIHEISNNMEIALNTLSIHDDDEKKNSKDNRGKLKLDDKTVEGEALATESQIINAIEFGNLHSRLQRIVDYGSDLIRDIRGSGLDLFQYIEDQIGASYRQELAAVKDLLFYVKLQIEQESRLPLEMQIVADNFELNQNTLTFVPEPPPAPPLPLEKELASFTIAQLLNLATSLCHLSKDGLISVKSMHALLKRLMLSPNAGDYFPAWIVCQRQAADQVICDLIQPHDPYEAGFLSWKKFIISAANILPCPKEQIEQLRHTILYECTGGLLPTSKFAELPLWFDDISCVASNTVSEPFPRGLQIRRLAEKLFMKKVQLSNDINPGPEVDGYFDVKSFAIICCCHTDAKIAVKNVFYLLGNAQGELGHSELLSITSFADPLRVAYSKDIIEEIFIRSPRGNPAQPQRVSAPVFLNALTEIERNASSQRANCLLYVANPPGLSGSLPSSRRSSATGSGKINYMHLVPRVTQQLRKKES